MVVSPFLDEGVGPDRVEQLASGHEAAGVLREHDEHVVHFRRQRNRRVAARHAPFRHVERELAKTIALGHRRELGES